MKKNFTQTRRQFIGSAATAVAGIALGTKSVFGAPAILQNMGKPNSLFKGVQIGTITYSYRSMPGLGDAETLLKYVVDSGISAIELYGPSAENFAGMPQNPNAGRGGGGGGRGARGARGATEQVELTPEQIREQEAAAAAAAAYQKQVADWRASVSTAKFEQFAKMYKAAGVSIYAWKPSLFGMNNTDADMNWGFKMAKALGASHVTLELPTNSEHTLRLGKLAAASKMQVAYHTHQQASITAFDEAFAQSPANMSNVDLGHYTAAEKGGDPVAFIKKHNARIASAHLKDRKTFANGAANLPWGEGDTPIAELLNTSRVEKYKFPYSMEQEYAIPDGSDAVKEAAKCIEFCRKALGA